MVRKNMIECLFALMTSAAPFYMLLWLATAKDYPSDVDCKISYESESL